MQGRYWVTMDPPYQEFEQEKLAKHGKENGLVGGAASILGDRNRVVGGGTVPIWPYKA